MPKGLGDPLEGFRVLDCAGPSGAYCGRLLADLGADVVLVEPPGGLASRRHAPLIAGESGTISCFDRFVNLNKRSVEVDLDTPAGTALLRGLLASAHVLIETVDGPTRWPGIDEPTLHECNPSLVRVLVSAFGTQGPYADRSSDDLTLLAAGGLLSLGGYEDTAPIAVHGEQSYFARSIFAAAGALVALLGADAAVTSDVVEVSAQEVIANALEDAFPEYDLNGRVRTRRGERPREAGTGTFRCADGYVAMVAGRLGTAKAFAALLDWINEAGTEGASELGTDRWQDHAFRQSAEGIAHFTELFERFAATRTKAELYREGQARKIAIAPVNSPSEVLADPQLQSRGYFTPVADTNGVLLTYPGRPYRIDGLGPFCRRPVPAVGEHNDEIATELGLGVTVPAGQ